MEIFADVCGLRDSSVLIWAQTFLQAETHYRWRSRLQSTSGVVLILFNSTFSKFIYFWALLSRSQAPVKVSPVAMVTHHEMHRKRCMYQQKLQVFSFLSKLCFYQYFPEYNGCTLLRCCFILEVLRAEVCFFSAADHCSFQSVCNRTPTEFCSSIHSWETWALLHCWCCSGLQDCEWNFLSSSPLPCVMTAKSSIPSVGKAVSWQLLRTSDISQPARPSGSSLV